MSIKRYIAKVSQKHFRSHLQGHVTSSLKVKNGDLCLDGGGEGMFFLEAMKEKKYNNHS